MTSEANVTTVPAARSDRTALLFVSMLIVACIALMATHTLVAEDCLTPKPDDLPDSPQHRPDRFAITYEVIVHALLGVTCRLAYIVGRSSLSGAISFTQMSTQWLSTAMFGCGTALALVFILRTLSINVNGVDVGLDPAELETFASVAFVLGFFNEIPRRLFARLRSATPPEPTNH